ncbi:hypothetical protein AVEN_208509-1 [Araneus ventricosus]|uniref:Uncharacterized protein n=1 Tax=Araneus ventricosus TaxID=182803 RepID=A0A4Y2E7X3_ARAVE|nr:hypothetical protein AVEN_208509-1 [Araneus ventricosus]
MTPELKHYFPKLLHRTNGGHVTHDVWFEDARGLFRTNFVDLNRGQMTRAATEPTSSLSNLLTLHKQEEFCNQRMHQGKRTRRIFGGIGVQARDPGVEAENLSSGHRGPF